MTGVLSTPRPVPSRRWPAAAGLLLIVLALPVFLAAGWPLGGWVLAAVLYLVGELLVFGLGRVPLGVDNLVSSGIVAVGMASRVIGVMIVLIAVTVADKPTGVSAALLYIAAYTLELTVSVIFYFGGEAR